MDDLISRSALMEELHKSDRDARTDSDIQGYCDGWNDVVEIINNQPTAYDVDAVVAGLEKAKGHYGYYGSEECEYVPYETAIDIVRNAGK